MAFPAATVDVQGKPSENKKLQTHGEAAVRPATQMNNETPPISALFACSRLAQMTGRLLAQKPRRFLTQPRTLCDRLKMVGRQTNPSTAAYWIGR